MIIVIIAIILIIIFLLCTIFKNNQSNLISFKNILGNIENKIAVVGNGPLSEEQRQKINNEPYNYVIRFIDLKNFKKGDRIDIHVIRYSNGEFSGINLEKNTIKLPIIPLLCNFNILNKYKLLDPIYIYEKQYKTKYINTKQDKFKPKNIKIGKCIISKNTIKESIYGFSSGGIILAYLHEMKDVKNIDVFGMNFNGINEHIDFKYPNIIPNCCSNVHFENT